MSLTNMETKDRIIVALDGRNPLFIKSMSLTYVKRYAWFGYTHRVAILYSSSLCLSRNVHRSSTSVVAISVAILYSSSLCLSHGEGGCFPSASCCRNPLFIKSMSLTVWENSFSGEFIETSQSFIHQVYVSHKVHGPFGHEGLTGRNPLFIKSMSLTKAPKPLFTFAGRFRSRNPLFIKSMSLTMYIQEIDSSCGKKSQSFIHQVYVSHLYANSQICIGTLVAILYSSSLCLSPSCCSLTLAI
mgnify:CR=1 FL=1